MSIRSDLISQGVYDRLVSVIGSLRGPGGRYITGEISPSSPSLTARLVRLRDQLGITGRRQVQAYYELADEARKAVNAARRYERGPGTGPTAGLPQLPCPENPGGRCGDRIEYTGYVVLVDPNTGVSSSVPFVVTSSDPLTRAQIASLASQSAQDDLSSRGYDKGGRIDPATATVGTVTITSISGRG